MAAINETPRQKMIGMMYLVLTALLALNVSREVLQAFNNLTKGIDETVQATEEKINSEVADFSQIVERMKDDSMAQVYWKKIETVVAISDTLDAEIERIKKKMVEAEKNQSYDNGPESYKGSNMLVLVDEENTDISSRFLADPNQAKNALGKKLKEHINTIRSQYLEQFSGLKDYNENDLKALENAFTLAANDDPTNADLAKRNWEFATFNNVPLGAALAILTKLQNDLRNTESTVISKLTANLEGEKRTVNGLEAMVMPQATNVPVGGTYSADIFLGAQLSSVKPIIEVDGKVLELDGSTGKYKITVSETGKVSKPVSIKLLNPKNGQMEEFTTNLAFEGFETPAIVSAQKMNVFYMDLENPVSVSVPGFDASKIKVSLSPASIGTINKNSNGTYTVKITSKTDRNCQINVMVSMEDGSTRNLKPQDFRIKKVPKPYMNINNKTGGTISRGEIATINKVYASMDPEFLFDGVRYKVTKFDYIYNPTKGNVIRGSSNSETIPVALKGQFNEAKTGDMLTIYQVYAKPVGFGEEVMLPGSLTFSIN